MASKSPGGKGQLSRSKVWLNALKYSYYRIVLTAVLIAAMTAGMLEAWTITPASASPAELHVGPGQPYATIQDAIDAASVGDTIIVHPWTYNEVINVTKDNLTIESTSGPEETIIDATDIPLNYGVGIVNVVGKSAVAIEGFTLKGASGKKYIAGIYLINNTGCAFSNNIITDISGEITPMGIGLWGSCADNVFVDNKITNITGFCPCGIMIDGVHPYEGWWAINNSFTNTIIDGINFIGSQPSYRSFSQGIYLNFGRRNTFTNTTLKNINRDEGIWVYNSVSNTFTDTTISNLTGLGIGISGSYRSDDNFFKNTHISGTTKGIHVGWYSSNTTLYGGEILGVRGGTGIGVSGREAGNANIIGFNISGGDYGVEMFGWIARVKVNHCNIYNNKYGIFFGGTCTYETCIDATLNWWGHPSGPYHPKKNPDGLGDEVSDNVEFKPWLIEPVYVYTLTIQLCEGWNLIGMSLQPENRTVEAVFAENLTYVKAVLGYDCGSWYYWFPRMEPNGPHKLTEFKPGYGYWVKASQGFTVTLDGTIASLPEACKGCNLIAMLGVETVSTVDYLDSNYPGWHSVWGWDAEARRCRCYIRGIGGDLLELKPGIGYWLHVDRSGTAS